VTWPGSEVHIAQLPFQVRPQSGEGARSFILRLAEANCLPPAYLRKFLAEPPLHRGGPSWDRIAAVTGREPVELQKILETIECQECGTPIRPMATFGVTPRTCSKACRQKRYRKGIPDSDWRKVPCRVCGVAIKFRLERRRHMCSSHCRRLAFEFRQRGQPLPWPASDADIEPNEEDEPDNLCPVCEGPMGRAIGRKACSRRCSARISHWTRSPLPPIATCRSCQDPVRPRADGRPRYWCSSDCRSHELRKRQNSGTDTIPSPVREARPGQGEPESPNLFVLSTCRGCERRYRPLRANPWCSRDCLDQEINKGAEQQECPSCGTSMAHRKDVPGRIWCSNSCRQKARYWRLEFRSRAGQPAPQTPSLPTCRGCHRTFQPLRPNPWCSDRCFEQEILRCSDQLECAACGASTARLKPNPKRKWCSGTCQQRAVHWRAELRHRSAQAAIGPTSLSQDMQ
jgi:hypothetical protein